MEKINYYEKFGISRGMELEKIQFKIREKIQDAENDDSEYSYTDKYKEDLKALREAIKVFESEESRKSYDEALDRVEETASSTYDADKSETLDKWLPDAKKYYKIGHYDLAKTAYENAVSGGSPDLEDSDIFEFVSQVCLGTCEHEEALKFANKAVVGQPDNPYFLINKSIVLSDFERFADSTNGGRGPTLVEIEKMTLDLAVQLATENNDIVNLGHAYNNLAFVWYHRRGSDRDTAQGYAEKALEIFRGWTDANEVLQDIYNKKNANLKKEIQREKEKESAMKKAQEELNKVDKEIAELYAAQEKTKKMKTVFAVGVVVAIIGLPLLALYGLGLIPLIGGIITAYIGHKGKAFGGAFRLRNLQETRSKLYGDFDRKKNDYEKFRKNLTNQYKNFCAKFKEASEKYGINYINIDQAYLNAASAPVIAPAQLPAPGVAAPVAGTSAFCTGCGNKLEPDDVFCQKCGTRKA
ncbi:MAG: zinc ribbon domain-containing protein [Clostridium sp.]|jgi:tetratricopeptide (TPR) repeat protein|nr:zinc ribbon domain-containing protein [Clostridium sp.]